MAEGDVGWLAGGRCAQIIVGFGLRSDRRVSIADPQSEDLGEADFGERRLLAWRRTGLLGAIAFCVIFWVAFGVLQILKKLLLAFCNFFKNKLRPTLLIGEWLAKKKPDRQQNGLTIVSL
jgi:hypothetical protein